MGATEVAESVFEPGIPGTDTSARLVTQVTLTDTVASRHEVRRVRSDLGRGTGEPGPRQGARHRRGRLGLGFGGVSLDDGGLDSGPCCRFDVALGRINPAEGHHQDDDDEQHRGDDDQFGDGLALIPPDPASAVIHWSGTPGSGHCWWPTR